MPRATVHRLPDGAGEMYRLFALEMPHELKVLKYPYKAPKKQVSSRYETAWFAQHARQCRLMARH
jgi:hypothetical protein